MAESDRDRESALKRIERVVGDADRGLRVPADARNRAYSRARAVLEAPLAGPEAADVATLGFAVDLLAATAVELAARPSELRSLIDRIESVSATPRLALGCELLRVPHLLQLPTAVGIEVQLALLRGFTGADSTSLWMLLSGGELRKIAHAGEFDLAARPPRQLARRLLSGASPDSPRGGTVAGVVVERWHKPTAALIAHGRRSSSTDRGLLLEAAAPILTALLERDELLGRGAAGQQASPSTERTLTRLRFDLHDGPQQDVILLAEDLRLFRGQLKSVMKGNPMEDRMIGRLDDLEARLVALDGDLRRISVMVQSPFLQPESLPDALAHLAEAFAARTGVVPKTRLRGDFTGLTDSQQITLLGLIREALSNIREHSDAEHVTITLAANAGGVEATVTDDGRGFDPEATLVRAARDGHLGLVGMHERVRLLGGNTRIDSRPGGPTVISASLPVAPASAPRRTTRKSSRRARAS